jgi:secreted PhoX family phosphatase
MNNIFKDFKPEVSSVKPGDEPLAPIANESDNEHFSSVLEKRLSRRQMLGGSLGAAVVGMFGASGLASFSDEVMADATRFGTPFIPKKTGTFKFEAVPPSRSDTVIVPKGYKAKAFLPWGTPLTGSYPAYDAVNGNSGAEQEQQVGSNHDGMHYFPLSDAPNSHGLLCINHEYFESDLLHVKGPTYIIGKRPSDEVRKEVAAHGVSIAEIKKNATTGEWELVRGRYNRRITAGTPMDIRGPVRGSDLVKTKHWVNLQIISRGNYLGFQRISLQVGSVSRF